MTKSSKVISINDLEYPKLLKEIKDAPKRLYHKGDYSPEIFNNCLAVVGSRRMTSYGKRAIEKIVSKIAASGITIVSGFMFGVDATAHKAALDVGGRTIAVMPCGIDIIHPEYQEKLYNDILKNNGLIISEFENDLPPALWTYPKRNRIVAGLSQATLVIEAAINSGSLITAKYAKEYNRKLFVVPGPITSANSEGINQLMKEGASIASKAEDVLEYYKNHGFFSYFTPKGPYVLQKNHNPSKVLPEHNFSSRFTQDGAYASQKNHTPSSPLESKIITELKNEPMEVDVLARMLGMSASEIGTKISLMQLQGIITKQGNKYYIC